jgi:hypothetical protein
MRGALMLLYGLWMLLCFEQFACAAPGGEQVRIAGKEYTRLADWARGCDLSLRWLKRDESLELNGSACASSCKFILLKLSLTAWRSACSSH